MSRSGYSDDCENWSLICWRGAVKSSIRGKRGQKLIRELIAALEAMPEKRLIDGEIECEAGVCALGAVGRARGLDTKGLDPDDSEEVSEIFDIANALAREVVFQNDEGYWGHGQETPEHRWQRMHKWAKDNLIEETK